MVPLSKLVRSPVSRSVFLHRPIIVRRGDQPIPADEVFSRGTRLGRYFLRLRNCANVQPEQRSNSLGPHTRRILVPASRVTPSLSTPPIPWIPLHNPKANR